MENKKIDDSFKELLLVLMDEAKKAPATVSREMLLAIKECIQIYHNPFLN